MTTAHVQHWWVLDHLLGGIQLTPGPAVATNFVKVLKCKQKVLVQRCDAAHIYQHVRALICNIVSTCQHVSVCLDSLSTLLAGPAGDAMFLTIVDPTHPHIKSSITTLDAPWRDVFAHVSIAFFEALGAHKLQKESTRRLLCQMSKNIPPG